MASLKSFFSTQIWVAVGVLGTLIIMYGLQKKTEKYVKNLNLDKTYSKLSRREIRMYRFLGVVFFCGSFALIWVMVILFHQQISGHIQR